MNIKDALQLADSIDPHDFSKSCEKHDKFDLAWALRVLAGAYRRLQISHNMKSKLFSLSAAGQWLPIHLAPKDKKFLLIKFKNGLCHVCRWAPSEDDEGGGNWVIHCNDSEIVIKEEPVAWAEIF